MIPQKTILAAALLVSAMVGAQAVPAVTLTPSASQVPLGSNFTVSIDIADVTDLYYWEIDLGFTPSSLVAATGQATGSFFGGLDLFVPGTINNPAGTISNVASTLFGANGVDGGGRLATITFNAQAVGVADFSFVRVLLGNSNLDPIFISNSNWTPGQVTVVPEPAAATLALLGGLLTLAAARRRRATP